MPGPTDWAGLLNRYSGGAVQGGPGYGGPNLGPLLQVQINPLGPGSLAGQYFYSPQNQPAFVSQIGPNFLAPVTQGNYGQSVSGVFNNNPPTTQLTGALAAIINNNPNISPANLQQQLQTLLQQMQNASAGSQGGPNQFNAQLQQVLSSVSYWQNNPLQAGGQQTVFSQQQLAQLQAALAQSGSISVGQAGTIQVGNGQGGPQPFFVSQGTVTNQGGQTFGPGPGQWSWQPNGLVPMQTQMGSGGPIPINTGGPQYNPYRDPNLFQPNPNLNNFNQRTTPQINVPVRAPSVNALVPGPLSLAPPYISVPVTGVTMLITGASAPQVGQAATNILQQGPGAWALPLQQGQIIPPTFPNYGITGPPLSALLPSWIPQSFLADMAGSDSYDGLGGGFTPSFQYGPAFQALNPYLPVFSPTVGSGMGHIDPGVTGGTSVVAGAGGGGGGGGSGPVISGISPNYGLQPGGASVNVNGGGFLGATNVKFGNVAATSFTIVGNNQILATSPAQGAGTVDVRVMTPAGTSPATPADAFTYN